MPWGALGGLLLAFWGPLGCLGCLLGDPWCFKVVCWCPSCVRRGALGVSWGPSLPQGGLLGGSWVAFWLPWCRLVRFLVALGVSRGFLWRFRGLARNPAAKKRAVETQAGHTHTHATSFTKPRFPFHDSQVYGASFFDHCFVVFQCVVLVTFLKVLTFY